MTYASLMHHFCIPASLDRTVRRRVRKASLRVAPKALPRIYFSRRVYSRSEWRVTPKTRHCNTAASHCNITATHNRLTRESRPRQDTATYPQHTATYLQHARLTVEYSAITARLTVEYSPRARLHRLPSSRLGHGECQFRVCESRAFVRDSYVRVAEFSSHGIVIVK